MKKQKPEISVADRDSYTIEEFCVANGICRSSYYNMAPEDRPVEMVIGGSKRISREAGFDWRRRMEAKAAEARAAEREVT